VSRCHQCQHDNPGDARFCLECGLGLALKCLACGTELPSGAKFCKECGQAVGKPAPSPPTRFGGPDSYTPKHLAERIFTSKAALEGERKQVTVLFADLKGSMELLADRDPEEARKILDSVLELMMEAVHRFEGTVNQVMGDGIMALFGAPLAHEDHAVRACYAALRMQESVKRYAEQAQRTQGTPVHIRVGLNSGEVVVRSIASDLRMDYSAVGQTTHLAARMEQSALSGSILITPHTLRLAEGYVQVKPLGALPVKGMTAPLEVYEVTGAGTVRSRFKAAVARGLTKFVGRDDDLSRLGKALAQAAAGHGQVMAVVGEPGVGKSRLFHEFMHSDRTEGWLILESGSVSYGRATPYLPLIDLLKTYFRVESRDDSRSSREKVAGKVLMLDRALEPILPAFLALLDLPVEEPQWAHLDPSQRRQRTLDAIKRLLLRQSQVQPLCLVFEDLHWIDGETQAFLDSLFESLPTARILLLANYRPEYQHRWGGKTYYTQVRIDPLAPASANELLQALLSADDLTALKALLIERTEGNPFFLEESVRTLVEAHTLVGERGAYRLAAPLSNVQVPSTVHAVLAARIDRLSPEEKSLLQIAAVVGKDVPFQLLQAVAARPEESICGSVSDLQAAEFLYETRLFPDLEYTFQARAHPRGRLRKPAPGSTPRPPCEGRGDHRAGPCRPPVRARGAACTPCLPGRGVGESSGLCPPGWHEGDRSLGRCPGRRVPRPGARGPGASVRQPGHDAAGDRSENRAHCGPRRSRRIRPAAPVRRGGAPAR
jgi:class 3 adenylate cyclase